MNYIYYDNESDLEAHVETFKQNISKVVSDNDIDKWTWSGCGDESYGVQYSCPVEESLKIEILKLTKNQNPEWVENISQTIGNAIRATAFSISCMDKFGVNFDEAVTDFNKTYNEGYLKLGKKNVVRPVLFVDDKPIGGHCVVPNAEILNNNFKSEAVDLILKYKPKK